MSINKAIVVGNLGRWIPSVRALPSGQNVANFSVTATTEAFQGSERRATGTHRMASNRCIRTACGQLPAVLEPKGRVRSTSRVWLTTPPKLPRSERTGAGHALSNLKSSRLQMRFARESGRKRKRRAESESVRRHPVLKVLIHATERSRAKSGSPSKLFEITIPEITEMMIHLRNRDRQDNQST